jgi:ligand-binding sensor domain-containing protein
MAKRASVVFAVWAVSWMFAAAIHGIDPNRAVTQYKIDCWTDENGLPQNSVRSILQTGDGYLWIATEEGLSRYDGVKFTTFDESNTPAISNNYIFEVFEDSRRNLWISTRSGLIFYKNGRFSPFRHGDVFSSHVVQTVLEDGEGNLWIGTDGDGLFKYEKDGISRFTTKQGLPDDRIKSLKRDSKGNFWVGTPDGLALLKNNAFVSYSREQGLGNLVINCVYEEKDGNLWIGTDKGIYILQGDGFTLLDLGEGIEEARILKIMGDRDGNIWIGTAARGLWRYRDGRLAVLTKKDGLSDDTIKEICEDREGSLWLGTAHGGLNRLKVGKFTPITTKEGLSDDFVFAIYEDSRGYLWIGTNNGLNRFKNRIFMEITTAHGLVNNTVDSLYEDGDGFIWVGTDDGITKLKNEDPGVNVFELPHEARGHFILALSGDRNGNIWFGTQKGLFKLKGDDLQEFSTEHGLPSKTVNYIYEDSKRNLWISAYRRGLAQYREDGTFLTLSEADGLVNNSVTCIYEDADSVLWIGTVGGLSRYKDGKFTNFTRKDGLYNNNIFQVLEDASGYLWMSCNKGIFKVKKKELNEAAKSEAGEARVKRITSVVYGKEDGMLSIECNGCLQTPGCKTKDGKLWFPTGKGVVMIDPDNIAINEVPPPVFVERVLLDSTSSDLNREITVTPEIKRVEIHYTALSFLNPLKVKFKYMMEGFDEQWVDAGTQRVAFYTNLDAGFYRFRVIACNDDGIWNDKGASAAFTVIAPIWKTLWFRFLTLVVFAVLSYAIINFSRKYISLSRFWKKQKFVGNFRLLDKLGAGGMGTIYKAKSLSDKTEPVAIKILKEELFEDENNRKRFKQEAAIIDQLDHPNIVRVIERGQSRDTMFIAMELLEGRTLARKIAEDGRLDLIEALHIMIQITDAAAKIHSKNIVHRDFKPDNIMLIKRGTDPNFVKLLDFGLAKTQYQTRLTQTGVVIGTITYMAPEQISGSDFSVATDIYSMGVMFYEMLTGQKPFTGDTTIDIMRQIVDKTPIEPVTHRFDISMELNELVLEMMEKEREARPQVEDVLERLRRIESRLKDLD